MCAAACSKTSTSADLDGEHNPYFLKAKRAMEERDFKAAAQYYDKALQAKTNEKIRLFDVSTGSAAKLRKPVCPFKHLRIPRRQIHAADIESPPDQRLGIHLPAGVP